MMQAAKDSIDLGIICGDIHASLHFYHDMHHPLVLFTRPKTSIRHGTTIAMVKDPDGNIVEFVERG